jgi:hypothetical protein
MSMYGGVLHLEDDPKFGGGLEDIPMLVWAFLIVLVLVGLYYFVKNKDTTAQPNSYMQGTMRSLVGSDYDNTPVRLYGVPLVPAMLEPKVVEGQPKPFRPNLGGIMGISDFPMPTQRMPWNNKAYTPEFNLTSYEPQVNPLLNPITSPSGPSVPRGSSGMVDLSAKL